MPLPAPFLAAALTLFLVPLPRIMADEAVIPLQFTRIADAAPAVLGAWLSAHGGLAEGETAEALLAKGTVTRDQNTVGIDDKQNAITITGDAAAVAQMRLLVTALDVTPIPVTLEVAVLEIRLPDEKQEGLDLFAATKRDADGRFQPDDGLAGMVKDAENSARAGVLYHETLTTNNNKATEFTIGQAGVGHLMTVSIRPLVNSRGQVTLEVAQKDEYLTSISTLDTHVTLDSGQIIPFGGILIQTDGDGKRLERLLLIQPSTPRTPAKPDGTPAPPAPASD